jgi:hypothetical protein
MKDMRMYVYMGVNSTYCRLSAARSLVCNQVHCVLDDAHWEPVLTNEHVSIYKEQQLYRWQSPKRGHERTGGFSAITLDLLTPVIFVVVALLAFLFSFSKI